MSAITNDEPLEQYSSLADIRRDYRVKWYRCPIEPKKLREFSERSDSKGWLQAGGHFLLYLLFAILAFACWAEGAYLLCALFVWCSGFVASFYKGTASHELGHGTVFQTRWLNRFFLYLVCLISWWDPYDYASSHTFHHRYTTHKKADRENVLPLEPSLHPWLVFQLFTINLFSPPGRNFGKGGFLWTVYLTARRAIGKRPGHTNIPSQEWLESIHADQPEGLKQSIAFSRVQILFHSGVLLTAALTGNWILVVIITMVSYIANIGSYLLGVTQHCGMQENATDFRKNTRSLALNPLMSFLYWQMNWHIEHHMYAGVPCYNLPKLAEAVKHDMPEPRSVYNAWKEMRDIHRRQQQDPTYQFEPQVPNTDNQTVERGDKLSDADIESLVSSIGDLEPSSYHSKH